MRHIPPNISRDRAVALFEYRLKKRFGRFFRRQFTPACDRLPRAELIWMPYHVVTLRVSSRKGRGAMASSIDAWSGAFAIFQTDGAFADRPCDGQAFPPRLSSDEAVEIARGQLLETILRQRSYGPKPLIEGVDGVELLHYPYWVYYYERRRGLLDFLLLDAVTGERGGARTKTGILHAFKAHTTVEE